MKDLFHRVAHATSMLVGSPGAFLVAVLVIFLWVASGPWLNYSDTWQLTINTATTIITFLIVFLIQNTQNRDAKAIHLKLDELIKSSASARNTLIDLEEMSDAELNALEEQFRQLRRRKKKN